MAGVEQASGVDKDFVGEVRAVAGDSAGGGAVCGTNVHMSGTGIRIELEGSAVKNIGVAGVGVGATEDDRAVSELSGGLGSAGTRADDLARTDVEVAAIAGDETINGQDDISEGDEATTAAEERNRAGIGGRVAVVHGEAGGGDQRTTIQEKGGSVRGNADTGCGVDFQRPTFQIGSTGVLTVNVHEDQAGAGGQKARRTGFAPAKAIAAENQGTEHVILN